MTSTLVNIGRTKSTARCVDKKIFLNKPPYFTPWTPPLGIAILKSYLQQHGYSTHCVDFNVDPELWGMHHKYFAILRSLEDVSINDGYSKLWWILNAHMLAYVNTGNAAACTKVLTMVAPHYGIRLKAKVIQELLPLVENFFKRLEVLINQCNLSEFYAVGTSTYTTSLASSLFILKKVKEQNPRVRTVMGGGVFADDLALGSDNLETLKREYDYVDNIILGEGELLLLKVIDGDLAGKRITSIADLGSTTLTMKDVPIPDFSDFNLDDYYHLTIEGARSCPFQCSFCSETIQWGDYRKKPIDQFVEQVITLARQYRNNSFFMGDSLMNPYINPFAAKLIESKANVLYDGYLRGDKPVTNRKFVKLWADSGCYRVRLGIESASVHMLEAMDKMTTPKVISDVLKALASAGLRTTTYWIVGFPGETESDFQETLDFVKEHHRYIYELEAHPYYYYPYGQVGSRLHQCYSLYQDEVTDIIKFKVWEIVDANPTREQRYERLRRFSRLASDLGLPNIYTMADRFQAEDRWHTLSPLAAKVYEGTGYHYEKLRPPEEAIPAFVNIDRRLSADISTPEEAVICYRARVSKKLDPQVLFVALQHVIDSQPLLQMRLQDGNYVAAPSTGVLRDDGLLFSTQREPEAIDKVSATMRPEQGSSIRAVLFDDGTDSSGVFLLLHKSIGDGKSVTLLFEALFRVYEQLSKGRAVSLRSIRKSYVDFMCELDAKKLLPTLSANGHASENGAKTQSESVSIDRDLVTRMCGTALSSFGLKSREVLLVALLRSLTQLQKKPAIDVTIDYRTVFSDIEETVGALTRICQLPDNLTDVRTLASSSLRKIQQRLREVAIDSLRAETSPGGSGDLMQQRLLLNFEYFIEVPWLGGDQWQPEGFFVSTTGLGAGYDLQIIPVQTGDELLIRLVYKDQPAAQQLAEVVRSGFTPQIKAIVEYCESYVRAKESWSAELER